MDNGIDPSNMDSMIKYLWGRHGICDEKTYDLVLQAVLNEQNQEEYNEELEALKDLSFTNEQIPFRTIKKEKSKGTKRRALKVISLLLTGAILGNLGINYLKGRVAYTDKLEDLTSYASNYLSTNFDKSQYGEAIANGNSADGYTWWYDIPQMAEGILNSTSYDIDTRIYGCYNGMNEYNKLSHMNELFYYMQQSLANGEYPQDIINACNHSSFEEYLNSKGMTLEEYKDQMDKIVTLYGQAGEKTEEISELLAKLNGGTR